MSNTRVIELASTSSESFEDAAEKGVARASRPMESPRQARIRDYKVAVEDQNVTEFRVRLEVQYVRDREPASKKRYGRRARSRR